MRNILALIFLFLTNSVAYSYQISDDAIKNILIQQSISTYLASKGNCPCPYNINKAGKLCGKRSAWSREGGDSPLCYPHDITPEMLSRYRNKMTFPSNSTYKNPFGNINNGGDEGPMNNPKDPK